MRGIALLSSLLLAACGQGQSDPASTAMSEDEARALGEAAEMLDQRRLSPEQLRDVPAVDTAPAQQADAAGAQGDAGK